MRVRASIEAVETTVFLVEDNIVMREGLRALLGEQTDIKVVGYAPFGDGTMSRLKETRPAVVVLDVSKSGTAGVEMTRDIGRRCAFAQSIVISRWRDLEDLFRLLDAGAKGYVLAELVDEEIVGAIRAVRGGHRYLSDPVSTALIDDFMRKSSILSPKDPLSTLSMKERVILQLVAEGKTSITVGRMVNLSPKTVNTYRCRLMKKLGIDDLTGLVRFAIRNGLTPLSPNQDMGDGYP